MLRLLVASVLVSCRTSDSGLDNTGPEIPAQVFPATLLLEMKLVLEGGVEKQALCTGSFITPRYFLTAAHCTVDPVTNAKIIEREFTISANKGSSPQISSKVFVPHPDYPGQSKVKSDVVQWLLVSDFQNQDIGLGYSDVAVIDIGTDQHSFPLIKIADAIPKPGERVHVVGFGVQPQTNASSGIKRAGTNLIFRSERGGLQTQINEKNLGTADTTVVGGGDSGGVLYNEQGEAVGIVSIGIYGDNVFVQLQHPKVQSFFLPFLAQAKQKK